MHPFPSWGPRLETGPREPFQLICNHDRHEPSPETGRRGDAKEGTHPGRLQAPGNGKHLEIQRARIEEVTLKAVESATGLSLLPHFIFSGELTAKDNPLYSFTAEVLGQE